MKITLESTSEIVEVAADRGGAGLPVRVWTGHTDAGIPLRALVVLVAVERSEQQEAFERELEEKFPRAGELRVFPARLVLP